MRWSGQEIRKTTPFPMSSSLIDRPASCFSQRALRHVLKFPLRISNMRWGARGPSTVPTAKWCAVRTEEHHRNSLWQPRTHQSPQPIAQLQGRQIRNPRMSRLVQPPRDRAVVPIDLRPLRISRCREPALPLPHWNRTRTSPVLLTRAVGMQVAQKLSLAGH